MKVLTPINNQVIFKKLIGVLETTPFIEWEPKLKAAMVNAENFEAYDKPYRAYMQDLIKKCGPLPIRESDILNKEISGELDAITKHVDCPPNEFQKAVANYIIALVTK